jgi:hypothetical protein
MSAWLVSKKHIDALVYARSLCRSDFGGTLADGLLPDVSDDDLGRLLWRENMRSLAARYRDRPDAALLASYSYAEPGPLPVVALIKASHCYEYQSCEHPGWKTSKARRFSRELVLSLAHKLPGYDAAPWGID